MPRRRRCRYISKQPNICLYKPVSSTLREIDDVIIFIEEYEAMHLKDYLGLSQEECAKKMNISQPTFHRLIGSLRKKMSIAFIEGKAIKIEGGSFFMKSNFNKKKYKLAICSDSDSLDADVASRLARCNYFIIVEIENGKINKHEVISNPHIQIQRGAGVEVSQMLAKKNIELVICENFGPRALDVFKQFNIQVLNEKGSIKKVLEKLLKE